MGDTTNLPAVIEQPEGGGRITRPSEEAGVARTLGETEVSPEVHAAASRQARRADMFDNTGDKALTFAEGVVDAFSLGMLHEHGDAADLRRDVNSGSALLGQLGGTALSLGFGVPGVGEFKGVGGPLHYVAGVGAKAGKTAAEVALGTAEIGSRAGIAARAVESAGEGAAIMGAGAFGHELSDSIIEDKPFASEVVVHEATLGGLLSGAAGLLSGAFSRAASRVAVADQGGIVAGEGLGGHVKEALSGLDSAVDTHAQRLGALEVLADEGHLPDNFMEERRTSLKAAQKAQDAVSKLDPEEMLKAEPKQYSKWREALDDYQDKVSALDDAMRPKLYETAPRVQLGKVEDVPGYGKPVQDIESGFGPGEVSTGTDEVVNRMRSDPEAAARYKEMYGRDFNESDAAKAYDAAATHNATAEGADTEPMRAQGPAEGSATPVDATNVGKRTPGAKFEPSADWQPVPDGAVMPAGGEYRMPFDGQTEARWPHLATPEARYSEMTQGLQQGRRIVPSETAMARDNVLSNAHADLAKDQVLLPDGYFMPAKQAEDVGQAFSRFQDKMADDTLARKARKAESLDKFRASRAASPEPVEPVFPTPDTIQAGRPVRAGRDTLIDDVAPGRLQGALDKDMEGARTQVRPMSPGAAGDRTMVDGVAAGQAAGKGPNVRQYLADWQAESQKLGPRISPGDKAAAQIRSVMNDLKEASGGRFDSASTLDLAEKLGVSGARTPLGEVMDHAWTIRQAGKLAADESRGVATPLRQSAKSHVMDWLKRRAGGKIGASVVAGVIGNKIGGPAGYFLGAALASKYMGFGGRVAAAAGRTYRTTIKAADGLLRGSRSAIAARAVAGNRPYQYSDRGPIKEPVERIQEIQRMAGNPDQIRAQVQKSIGDLVALHPAIAQMVEDRAVAQVTQLSIKAPAIYFNQLGQAMPPSAGDLRKFLEYENATHSYEGVLNSVGNGSVTRAQAEALRDQWPEVHGKLVTSLLADPEALKTMNREKLRTIEMVTGYPLTPGSDPAFIARQQQAWLSPTSTPGRGSPGGGKPQSFKITAPAPTPSQAQARAPGN